MTNPPDSEIPTDVDAASPSRRTKLIGLGLVVFGLLAWGNQGPLASLWLFVPTVALTAALVGHTFTFGWFDRVQTKFPQVPWSNIYAIAITGLLAVGLLRAGAFFGFFVYGIGLVLLIRQGPTTVGPLDVRNTWAPWSRRAMLVLLLLAALTLSTQWDGDFNSSYTYESGGWLYTNTTSMDGRDAYGTGDAKWLTVPIVAAFAALALRRTGGPSWYRVAPLVPGVVAAVVALMVAIGDDAEVRELYEIGGTYAKFNAEGPAWFLIFIVPYCIVAAVFAFRKAEPRRQ